MCAKTDSRLFRLQPYPMAATRTPTGRDGSSSWGGTARLGVAVTFGVLLGVICTWAAVGGSAGTRRVLLSTPRYTAADDGVGGAHGSTSGSASGSAHNGSARGSTGADDSCGGEGDGASDAGADAKRLQPLHHNFVLTVNNNADFTFFPPVVAAIYARHLGAKPYVLMYDVNPGVADLVAR